MTPRPAATAPDLEALGRAAESRGSTEASKSYADALALWGGSDSIDQTIAAYQEVAERNPDDGMTHFRLGVAYRMRYDSQERREGDFQTAIDEWSAALALDPNQYIWRRRVQQYGPRLDKPYPFYDWVPAARDEIVARGEQPVPLVVEPRGSEFASPAPTFTRRGTHRRAGPNGARAAGRKSIHPRRGCVRAADCRSWRCSPGAPRLPSHPKKPWRTGTMRQRR